MSEEREGYFRTMEQDWSYDEQWKREEAEDFARLEAIAKALEVKPIEPESRKYYLCTIGSSQKAGTSYDLLDIMEALVRRVT